MTARLEGKTAFITGASSGLGRAIAIRYAQEGAKICCADLFPAPRTRNTDSSKLAVEERSAEQATHELLSETHGADTASFVRCDVLSAKSIEQAIQACVDKFGRLDVLVTCAGISIEGMRQSLRCHETPEEEWDKEMGINAKGVFLACKYALAQMVKQDPLPGLRDKGWIVNLSSIMGFVTAPGLTTYCASKGAVLQLTRQIGLDYAQDRIHSNCICPGFVKTAMTMIVQNDPKSSAITNTMHPFGGMGEPQDIANAAVFLASSDASWVTGHPLVVDGGYTLR